MARSRKKAAAGDGGGAPKWMVTYGDLMSLLLTFFVLLLSFSQIKVEDFDEALASIRREIFFMDFDAQQPEVVPPVMEGFSAGQKKQQLRAAAERVREAAAALALELDVSAEEETEGLRITIQAPVLFDSGQAVLRPAGEEILRAVLDALIAMPNAIVVDGHTDNVPIHTAQFPSNWELSTARAIAVARFFMDGGGMQPKRVGVAGYGEYRPLATNDTPAGRARNRRVELFVYKDAEE